MLEKVISVDLIEVVENGAVVAEYKAAQAAQGV